MNPAELPEQKAVEPNTLSQQQPRRFSVKRDDGSPIASAEYLSKFKEEPYIGAFDDAASLIRMRPDIANELHEVFESVPELMKPFASLAWYKWDKNNAGQYSSWRVSLTDRNEDVIAKLEENRRTFQQLTNKLTTILSTEKFPGYPYWVLASPFEVAEIIAFPMEHREKNVRKQGLMISITPSNSKQYDFVPYNFQMLEDGTIDSTSHTKDMQNFGYDFKKNERPGEKEIVEALLSYPYQSSELNETLEGIPALDKYLSS